MKPEELREIIRKKKEREIHISDLHKEVKTKYMKLAREYFRNDYAITLKYLIDVSESLQLEPNEELGARIDTLASELEKLKQESVESKVADKPQGKKMLDGRVIGGKKNVETK